MRAVVSAGIRFFEARCRLMHSGVIPAGAMTRERRRYGEAMLRMDQAGTQVSFNAEVWVPGLAAGSPGMTTFFFSRVRR